VRGRHGHVLTRVLTPLLIPGILAAGLLVLVRTVAMFELTFLPAGPRARRCWSRSTTPRSPPVSTPTR
jgi:ABC-type spermidine/putrescine transport system permease subunit II